MNHDLSFFKMPQSSVRQWLLEADPHRLEALFVAADTCRLDHVGNSVLLRGLVEISSHCSRACRYCGLRAGNRQARRYRMTAEEILDCARRIDEAGVGTVVLQAGEDPALSREFVGDVIRNIKDHTRCAVTLSLSERNDDDYVAWKHAGADRYLLRFETSDRGLYESLHPPKGEFFDRPQAVQRLRAIGYEVGSGFMFGLPGQTPDQIVDDLMLLRELDLDMIGCGPFLPHPNTPLGKTPGGTLDMAYRIIALCRLLSPKANIPATTAIATLGGEDARKRALSCGANVIMPNFTPPKYREQYEIYPDKACPLEGAEIFCKDLHKHLSDMGRVAG